MNLEYHVPRLGKLKVRLFKNAQKAYELLEHANHIEKMKRNHQLGVIRNVYEGAHHTRWEYVMTILYIINYLVKARVKGYGLSNDTPKIKGHKVSGAEILQIWTLLLNAGHLKGTFATEQALLSVLISDSKIRSTYRSGLPNDTEIRELFKRIIESQDIYRLHELQSFFFLERLRRKSAKDVDLLTEVLKLFKFDPSKGQERRRKLKYLYRKIRQISFLFLDSHYGPVPLNFELGQALFDFDEYSESIFSLEETPISRNLELFEQLMSENFYLAPKCMYAFGKQSRKIKGLIEEEPEATKKSIRKLYDFLGKGHSLDPKYWPKSSENLLRLWFDERRSPYFVLTEIKPIDLEESFRSSLSKTYCDVSVLHDPTRRMMGITIAIKEPLSLHSMKRLLFQTMQKLVTFQDEYERISHTRLRDPYRKIFKCSCKELTLFILKKLWGEKLIFSPIQDTVHQDQWAIGRGTTAASRWLIEQSAKYEERGIDPDRLHEIKTLAKGLEEVEHRGTVLFTTSQIIVRDRDSGDDISDLDGLAIFSTSNELSLLIVEAKNKRKGSIGDAKRRIRKILDAMGFEEVTDDKIQAINGFGAFAKMLV